MPSSPELFCVGWSPELSAVHLWHPVVPANRTKPEARASWLVDEFAKAPLLPFVGRPGTIYVLNEAAEVVLDDGSPAEFLDFADGVGKFSEMPSWGEAPDPHAIFIGLNIKELFCSVAACLWRSEGKRVPKRFWRHTPGVVEIYETLVPGDLRKGFDVGSLLAYAGSEVVPPELQHLARSGQRLGSAGERARVAWTLASFAQLF